MQRRDLKEGHRFDDEDIVVAEGTIGCEATGPCVPEQRSVSQQFTESRTRRRRLGVLQACRGRIEDPLRLLVDALRRVVRVADEVGIRALLIHARDEEARDFYLHHGEFVESPTDPLYLFLLLKHARRMLAEEVPSSSSITGAAQPTDRPPSFRLRRAATDGNVNAPPVAT